MFISRFMGTDSISGPKKYHRIKNISFFVLVRSTYKLLAMKPWVVVTQQVSGPNIGEIEICGNLESF